MTERRRNPPPEGDYEVGYCRPPKRGRFKPGQLGNPKGRPKGRKNIRAIFEETLYKPVTVTENGRKSKVPAIKALLLRLLNKSLEGDLRALDKLLKQLPMLQAAMAADEAREGGEAVDPEADAEALAEFTRMIRESEVENLEDEQDEQ
jgi:hypothetical protein